MGAFSWKTHIGASSLTGIRNDDLIKPAFFDRRCLCIELRNPNIAPTMNHIHAPILIKEQGHVMMKIENGASPRTLFNILGLIDVGFPGTVGRERNVIFPFMIPE